MSTLADTVAVDVALLPPDPVMDEAIRINQALIAGNSDGEVRLDRQTCIPHITVAMGAVRREKLREVETAVGRIARHCTPMTLTIDAIEHTSVSTGERVSAFHVLRPEIIQLFHKTVMNAVSRYAVPEAAPEMFADETVSASSVDCLRRFRERSSFARYSPHITLGFGEIEPFLPGLDFPLRFEVTRVAICHLGNHCTCREILAEFELKRNGR
jgi:2'-5' RNA ligase